MQHEALFLDFVEFADTQDSTSKFGAWADAVALSDSILSHQFFESFGDYVQYNDRLTGQGTYNVDFADELDFSDETQPFVNVEVVTEAFFMWDEFFGVNPSLFADSVTYEDEFSCYSGPHCDDTLALTDAIQYDAVLGQSITDPLVLTSAISGYLNDWRVPVFPILEET